MYDTVQNEVICEYRGRRVLLPLASAAAFGAERGQFLRKDLTEDI
jgi:hypothetical protein